MRKHFLIGNFLPAYGRAFGRLRGASPDPGALPPQRLADRFRQRAVAYRVRRSEYVSGLQLGVVGALVLTIAAFNLDWVPAEPDNFALSAQEVVAMEEIAQTLQIQKPPPPPPPVVPVAVPDDDILTDTDLDLDATLDLDAPLSDLPPPPPEPVRGEPEDQEPEVFFVVEEMPEIVGGFQALLASLAYPSIARKAELEGVVVVQVTIGPDGKPTDPVVVKSVHTILDQEAVRAAMAQRFKPGRQRGRPVTVAMNIPITFRLN